MGVFYIGGRGVVCFVDFCRYDIWMALLLVRSWARVQRVSLGRESVEEETLGTC